MKRFLAAPTILVLSLILLQTCGGSGEGDTSGGPAPGKDSVAYTVVHGGTGTIDTRKPNPDTKSIHYAWQGNLQARMSGFMFTVVIAVVIIAFSIVLPARRRARQVDRARKLASALGLRCLEGREAIESALAAAGTAEPNLELDKMPQFLRTFVDKAAGWRLDGTIENIRVAVWTETRSSGKTSSTWTMVRAYYPTPLAFELTLTPEGIMTKLGKAVFGLKDLELGDPVFDPKVRVKTSDTAQARSRLDIETRRAFIRLVEAYPEAVAHQAYVQWNRQGITFDEVEIRSVLNALAGIAARLGR